MRKNTVLLHGVAVLLLCGCGLTSLAREAVIGGPCQGCEWVFVDRPESLHSRARIAPETEPGDALRLSGVVRAANGQPAPGIVVYAYQTNAQGLYPKGRTQHGALRGWAISDAAGAYHFTTIRPGAYPGRTIPQHIHLHVIEPGKGTYYIDDVTFSDDPLLTREERRKKTCRAGCGVATPERDADGIWHVKRDIVLGKNVPGYDP